MKKYKKTISSKIRSWVAKYGGELDYEAFDSLMKILESKLALADKPKKSINILSDRNVDKLKECKHKWLYDGGLRMRCRNCGIYVDYNATPTPLKSEPKEECKHKWLYELKDWEDFTLDELEGEIVAIIRHWKKLNNEIR